MQGSSPVYPRRSVPVTENDALMSEEDFFKKIDRSIKQLEEGKGIRKKKLPLDTGFQLELCCRRSL